MYTGYLLSEKSRAKLLAQFPPKYPRVIAEHVTLEFGVPGDTPPPVMPQSVTIVGYVDSGDGVEGLTVEVDGEARRPDGKLFHITMSLDVGHRAVETNKHTENASPVEPIPVDVTPKTFTR
jgi:hypothetical protein